MIIDQTNDPGFSVLRVVVDKFPKLREMAKTANLDPTEFSSLPDEAFAWPGQRKFPIHNAEQAALSLGYSKIAAKLPSDVAEMMEKAASAYGINSEDFDPKLEKVAAVDDGYYLLTEEKRFRIVGPQDVPVAEQVIYEKYASLSIENRAEACLRLVEAARQYNVPLRPSTYKLAGFTMTSTQKLKDCIETRQFAAEKLGSAFASAYGMLAAKFRNVEPFMTNRADQIKLAGVIHELDEQAGLTQYYGKKLPDPISTVFNTVEKRADYVKIGSALQNKALLAKLPLSFWQDTLGPEISAEVAPNGQIDPNTLEQVIATLPADLKTALETQLAAYNK